MGDVVNRVWCLGNDEPILVVDLDMTAIFKTGMFDGRVIHREDGPAICIVNGCEYPGRGGSVVRFANGAKFWYKDGVPHREDGPAVDFANGGKAWWKDGKRIREDGPAVESVRGDKEWYRGDRRVYHLHVRVHIE